MAFDGKRFSETEGPFEKGPEVYSRAEGVSEYGNIAQARGKVGTPEGGARIREEAESSSAHHITPVSPLFWKGFEPRAFE